MRLSIIAIMTLIATAALGGETPSVKEDFKDAGRSIERGVEGTYDKAKDATVNGVGTALEKTGEGVGKAADKVEGAGEKVKDEAD